MSEHAEHPASCLELGDFERGTIPQHAHARDRQLEVSPEQEEIAKEEEGSAPDEADRHGDRLDVRDAEREGVGLRHDAGGALHAVRAPPVQPAAHQRVSVLRVADQDHRSDADAGARHQDVRGRCAEDARASRPVEQPEHDRLSRLHGRSLETSTGGSSAVCARAHRGRLQISFQGSSRAAGAHVSHEPMRAVRSAHVTCLTLWLVPWCPRLNVVPGECSL